MNMPPQLYLLDANILIDAHHRFYPHDMVPEFWDWLFHCAIQHKISMPRETFEEVGRGADGRTDFLSVWISQTDVAQALILPEHIDASLVGRVL